MSTVTDTTPLHERPVLEALPVEHLCDFSVDLEPAQLIATPVGTRMTFIARGGRVDGPRLRGEILPGGGDWLTVGTDQIGRVDVRATVRTHDEALIHYDGGRRHPAPRRTASNALEPPASGSRSSETYVRTTPQLRDLRRALRLARAGSSSLGYNQLARDHIDYRMYRVL